MSTKNDPAYPTWSNVQRWNDNTGHYEDFWVAQDGMTKLEWFAGMAMLGMCASNSATYNRAAPDMIAAWAFDQAEAMIAELEKRK